MRQMAVLMLVLPLLAVLLAPRPAAACGATVLEVGVRDLNDKPVAAVAFDIDVDGAQRTMATDDGGLLTLSCLEAKAVRIVAARTAAGQPLTIDENTAGGGLTIPLTEGQTVRLPLRLTGTLLFVEPVAEGEQSTVFSATSVAAPSSAARTLRSTRIRSGHCRLTATLTVLGPNAFSRIASPRAKYFSAAT